MNWERVRSAVEPSSWLRSVAASVEGKVLVLTLPNAFLRDGLRERHGRALEEAAREAGFERLQWRLAGSQRSGFAAFRVSPGNQHAWRVLSGLGQRLRSELHPVVLHGPAGSGKTHLLKALESAVRARRVSPLVATDAVRLSRRLALSAKEGRPNSFREALRSARLLILDDASRLRGKTRTQRELVYALDAMGQEGALAVLAFRDPPATAEGLDAGLRSRLQGGLEIELLPE